MATTKITPKFEEGEEVYVEFLNETREIVSRKYNDRMDSWGYRLRNGTGYVSASSLEKK